ncbi:hypothetical protein ACA910_013739 [Epithemia clementina (nom. ined.)]
MPRAITATRGVGRSSMRNLAAATFHICDPIEWERTEAKISQLRAAVEEAMGPAGDHKVDHKMLEQVAGFLNHVARAFQPSAYS